MIKKKEDIINKERDIKDLDDICDECKKIDESVTQNLILTGFKICKSDNCIKVKISNINIGAVTIIVDLK